MEKDWQLHTCIRCDAPGGQLTFDNQVCMPIRGKVQCVDWCIHQIVAALNAGGVDTVASCCGHLGKSPARIKLADGRTLTIGNVDEIPAAPDGYHYELVKDAKTSAPEGKVGA